MSFHRRKGIQIWVSQIPVRLQPLHHTGGCQASDEHSSHSFQQNFAETPQKTSRELGIITRIRLCRFICLQFKLRFLTWTAIFLRQKRNARNGLNKQILPCKHSRFNNIASPHPVLGPRKSPVLKLPARSPICISKQRALGRKHFAHAQRPRLCRGSAGVGLRPVQLREARRSSKHHGWGGSFNLAFECACL